MKTIISFIICCVALFYFPRTGEAFMSDVLSNMFGSQPSFACALEKDHNPPLDLNSEAHKLYTQARDYENARPARIPDGEEENLTAMYLEAAKMGHWKAKAEMVYRYANGIGIGRSSGSAVDLSEELVKAGVPIGYFNLGLFTMRGKGTLRNKKKGMELIHKAAGLGSRDAQYMLGEHYIYSEHDDVLGLKYHVCALRQGHAKSARAIARYLQIEETYPMAVQYLLRAGGLGHTGALVSLEVIFSSSKPNVSLGYNQNAQIVSQVSHYYDLLKQDPRRRFPNIGKECRLPAHPTLGDGRQLPSKLREACGGMWPDEAYPELKDW
jgi:TPR repeat protein